MTPTISQRLHFLAGSRIRVRLPRKRSQHGYRVTWPVSFDGSAWTTEEAYCATRRGAEIMLWTKLRCWPGPTFAIERNERT